MLDLYTLYHFAERLYTGFSRHLPGGYALPPLQMVIELTYRCNLKCEMCFQRRQMEQLHLRPGGPAQELSLEEIQRAVQMVARAEASLKVVIVMNQRDSALREANLNRGDRQ